MPLEFLTDGSPADWLSLSRTPPWQLITFGPAGFEQYARLRFLPDPRFPGQLESDVDLPASSAPEGVQSLWALERLRRFTSTPDRWYFCIWDGFGIQLPVDVCVDLGHRAYHLARGSLEDWRQWVREQPIYPGMPPAFAWPQDRSWCFTRDVDPHWAGVGGSGQAIQALLEDPDLDVVPADPAAVPPAYR